MAHRYGEAFVCGKWTTAAPETAFTMESGSGIFFGKVESGDAARCKPMATAQAARTSNVMG